MFALIARHVIDAGVGSYDIGLENQRCLAAVLAYGQRLTLKGKPVVDRGVRWGAKVRKRYQVLEIVGETVEDVGISPVVGVVLQRIAVLENPAGSVVAAGIDDQRIVSPFANLVR